MKGTMSQLADAGWKAERKNGETEGREPICDPFFKTKKNIYLLAVNKTIFSIQDEIDTVFAKYHESSLKSFSRARNDV